MARLKKLVQPSAVADQVLVELASRNKLVKAPDGKLTRQVLVKGLGKGRPRYVCIRGLVPKTSKVQSKFRLEAKAK